MSDLATALQIALANKTKQEKQMQTRTHTPEDIKKIANQWAKEDSRDDARSHLPHAFKPTNNVSRETFNAVRDNPRLQHKDIARMLTNRGFNAASIGSLLTQMLNCGMVTRDDNGRYTALQTEYTPIKVSKKKKVAVPAVKKKSTKSGIAALDTQDGVEKKLVTITRRTEATPPAPAFDPEQLLSTLSFAQVMALYKKIKTIVGEA
jgi:hypothetical protein